MIHSKQLKLSTICSFFLFWTRPLFLSDSCLNAADQLSAYEKELEEMKNMTRQEFVANLRR